jgi:hypothetical protein
MLVAMHRASSRVREVRRRAPSRLLLEIDVGECLPVGVADDEVTAAISGLPTDFWTGRSVA